MICAGSAAALETAGSAAGLSRARVIRQEYNTVAASIDTLFRLYGREQIDALTNPERPHVPLAGGYKLLLLFWADDEAEIFLNGTPISRTRLTPTQVEIPKVYLQAENELTARCWDTDGVESGFMAGLYLQDESGLRPVLTTGEEGRWLNRDGEPAQEFFYAHAQPDIPSARVIWGPQLFGEVQLSATFGAGALDAAGRKKALQTAEFRSRPMEFHEAVSALVSLQVRREELAHKLAMAAPDAAPQVRLQRSIHTPLSFSLGSAGPLTDEVNMTTAGKMLEWAKRLAPSDRDLVLRPARELRGREAATSAIDLGERITGDGGEEDRRRDYVPPAERGSAPGEVVVSRSQKNRFAGAGAHERDWHLIGVILLLTGYTYVTGRSWWLLYRWEAWRKR